LSSQAGNANAKESRLIKTGCFGLTPFAVTQYRKPTKIDAFYRYGEKYDN
jgi:hypothetical protein